MNKKGLIFRLLVILILLAILFFLFMRIAKSETAINIVNLTVSINPSNISINISNVLYQLNNSNLTAFIQQNFSVSYTTNITVNITNVTITNVTCSNLNNSLNVNCNCGVSTCNIPDNISISADTKNEIINNCSESSRKKIEESSNKISQDIIFKLEPTKAELDGCKQSAYNASIAKVDAERQRDIQLEGNKRLASELESSSSEKRMLMIASLVVIFIIAIYLAQQYLEGQFGKFRGLGGGGYE